MTVDEWQAEFGDHVHCPECGTDCMMLATENMSMDYTTSIPTDDRVRLVRALHALQDELEDEMVTSAGDAQEWYRIEIQEIEALRGKIGCMESPHEEES